MQPSCSSRKVAHKVDSSNLVLTKGATVREINAIYEAGCGKHSVQHSGTSHKISVVPPTLVQSAHRSSRIPSSRNSHTESGMEPTRSFSCRRNSVKADSDPDEISGTVPVNLFPLRNKSLNTGEVSMVEGMVELNMLF